MLRYESRYYTPELVRQEPDALWVFGDNLTRAGRGGQAVIRYEPNARGIATKHLPSWDPGAFFADSDLPVFLDAAAPVFAELAAHLRAGGLVVWPQEWIGTGRAQLAFRAPRIWHSLERARLRLEAIAGEGQPVKPYTIADEPLVRAVLKAFPGATIVAVRDRRNANTRETGRP